MIGAREKYLDTEFETPSGDLEQSVARIIADVLAVDRVGRADGFYDFHGTSLQAIRICARIESQLGIRARPVWLFSDDVLKDLVARLAQQQAEQRQAKQREGVQ